ncbi:hypothetical protein BDK51DRAFT_40703 [Blyttiomyces helicus]|uniref:Uncharacterized protein n=1 Tax=Blyttiomyces helicus TaxID=388810 RepID=A0A4P9WAT0_9FUNG|nr:hypothetical protein BDK51DRAFT_40703 [Blyttiomyces helicus]|eukprot:RKO89711.1 hypothetical protein BDK51DRAFT_40703 [Blyttiomyces helicus]
MWQTSSRPSSPSTILTSLSPTAAVHALTLARLARNQSPTEFLDHHDALPHAHYSAIMDAVRALDDLEDDSATRTALVSDLPWRALGKDPVLDSLERMSSKAAAAVARTARSGAMRRTGSEVEDEAVQERARGFGRGGGRKEGKAKEKGKGNARGPRSESGREVDRDFHYESDDGILKRYMAKGLSASQFADFTEKTGVFEDTWGPWCFVRLFYSRNRIVISIGLSQDLPKANAKPPIPSLVSGALDKVDIPDVPRDADAATLDRSPSSSSIHTESLDAKKAPSNETLTDMDLDERVPLLRPSLRSDLGPMDLDHLGGLPEEDDDDRDRDEDEDDDEVTLRRSPHRSRLSVAITTDDVVIDIPDDLAETITSSTYQTPCTSPTPHSTSTATPPKKKKKNKKKKKKSTVVNSATSGPSSMDNVDPNDNDAGSESSVPALESSTSYNARSLAADLSFTEALRSYPYEVLASDDSKDGDSDGVELKTLNRSTSPIASSSSSSSSFSTASSGCYVDASTSTGPTLTSRGVGTSTTPLRQTAKLTPITESDESNATFSNSSSSSSSWGGVGMGMGKGMGIGYPLTQRYPFSRSPLTLWPQASIASFLSSLNRGTSLFSAKGRSMLGSAMGESSTPPAPQPPARGDRTDFLDGIIPKTTKPNPEKGKKKKKKKVKPSKRARKGAGGRVLNAGDASEEAVDMDEGEDDAVVSDMERGGVDGLMAAVDELEPASWADEVEEPELEVVMIQKQKMYVVRDIVLEPEPVKRLNPVSAYASPDHHHGSYPHPQSSHRGGRGRSKFNRHHADYHQDPAAHRGGWAPRPSYGAGPGASPAPYQQFPQDRPGVYGPPAGGKPWGRPAASPSPVQPGGSVDSRRPPPVPRRGSDSSGDYPHGAKEIAPAPSADNHHQHRRPSFGNGETDVREARRGTVTGPFQNGTANAWPVSEKALARPPHAPVKKVELATQVAVQPRAPSPALTTEVAPAEAVITASAPAVESEVQPPVAAPSVFRPSVTAKSFEPAQVEYLENNEAPTQLLLRGSLGLPILARGDPPAAARSPRPDAGPDPAPPAPAAPPAPPTPHASAHAPAATLVPSPPAHGRAPTPPASTPAPAFSPTPTPDVPPTPAPTSAPPTTTHSPRPTPPPRPRASPSLSTRPTTGPPGFPHHLYAPHLPPPGLPLPPSHQTVTDDEPDVEIVGVAEAGRREMEDVGREEEEGVEAGGIVEEEDDEKDAELEQLVYETPVAVRAFLDSWREGCDASGSFDAAAAKRFFNARKLF